MLRGTKREGAAPKQPPMWRCPKCKRRFTRENQRHACGTGDGSTLLRNRPGSLAALYRELETFVRSLGTIEIVTRERYALFRSRRIFADLVVMSDALRLAIHLPSKREHVLFFKIASDRRHVTHVAKLRKPSELHALKSHLRDAYTHSLS